MIFATTKLGGFTKAKKPYKPVISTSTLSSTTTRTPS
jgi:hypothetical protein